MRLVVRQHRPFRQLILFLLGVVLISGGIWLFLDYDQWGYIQQRLAASAQRRSLWEQNRALQQDNEALRAQLARFRRQAQIRDRAFEEIRESLTDLQRDHARLQRELDFYHDVLGSSGTGRGLRLLGVHVWSDGEDDRYRYELVLGHLGEGARSRVVKGEVRVRVVGELEGRPYTLEPGQKERGEPLRFTVRNYLRLAGELDLPPGFEPKELRLALRQESPVKGSEEASFPWLEVLN
ncbi:MAG: hypothetical protein D6786_06340 [Gammaproteobacteria bacterium]|nr:MAG: hypothetical protein D6786_06340 [Gammaproteobacteria bacterium]